MKGSASVRKYEGFYILRLKTEKQGGEYREESPEWTQTEEVLLKEKGKWGETLVVRGD